MIGFGTITQRVLLEMADPSTDTPWDKWIKAFQTLGISTVAACALSYFAWSTIQWERDQMLPALHNSKTAIEGNTDVLEDTKQVLSDVKTAVRDLNESRMRMHAQPQ